MFSFLRNFVSRPFKVRVRSVIKDWIADHDTIYDEEYFNEIDRTSTSSAPHMAAGIITLFRPKTVLDVGCGTGSLLYELGKQGVTGVGLEYSEAAIAYCNQRDLDVRKFNLESASSFSTEQAFDIVVSFEVAEHLPHRVANSYVSLLCSHADIVLFTAAPPGQGGTDHINEQFPPYWIHRFGLNGFSLSETLTTQLKRSWKNERVSEWYRSNLMVFTAT
jgi:2-polyprenyl-3-methyl-5-hydroxy-6-metoxy-1,4-benzoquinol methylase